MISNMKRYKTLINQAVSVLDKRFSGMKFNGDCVFYRKYYPGNSKWGDMGFSFSAKVPGAGNFIAYESKNIVYIGLDLSNFRCMNGIQGQNTFEESIVEDMLAACYWNSNTFDKLFGYGCDYSLTEIRNERAKLYKTVAYAEVADFARKLLDTKIKPVVQIREGEWPKLDRRTILPVITLNFDSGMANWINNSYVNSYRKSNSGCYMDILFSKLQDSGSDRPQICHELADLKL